MVTYVICKSCAYKVTADKMYFVTISGCFNCGNYEFIIKIEDRSDSIKEGT